MLGSGVGPDNVRDFWPHADAFIVGTAFKRGGDWKHPPDPRRVAAFMKTVAALRRP